jgi:glycosyltransferase involved in cell wall biosynthesis
MKIKQVLGGAHPLDAVTNHALCWRDALQHWGWEGEVYSARPAPGTRRRLGVRRLDELQPDGNVLLVHYSGYAPELEGLFTGSARTLLLSHNVTPEDWFWPEEPEDALRCRLARHQLHELARRADRLAGVSGYNAAELRRASGREAEVIPILFDGSRLDSAASPEPRRVDGSTPPTVLFVGRLTPHKRQDEVLRAFALFRRIQPAARLVLVGHASSPPYGQRLRQLAAQLAPGAVSFEAELSPQELADWYRSADVFLCLSEHEGFCIPLLEAFHFGLPVIARDAAAVGEVVGDAGVLLGPQDDLATIAELLDIVTGDGELREALRRRGRERLRAYEPQITAQRMRTVLAELADG